MATKSKKWKKIISYCAFILGVTLLLGNGLTALENIGSLSSWPQEIKNAFSQDYQQTTSFRGYVSEYLERFLLMASGGDPDYWYGIYNSYGTEDIYASEIMEGVNYSIDLNEDEQVANVTPINGNVTLLSEKEANKKISDEIHNSLKDDKNMLYQVYFDGKLLYSNNDDLKLDKDGTMPDGYNFYLYFDGEKVKIIKDGKEIDVYGDGTYRYENDWYVPGYENFKLDDTSKKAEVVMAIAKTPKIYVSGNYSSNGSVQKGNTLYWMAEGMKEERSQILSQGISLLVSVVLLAVYLILRKSKQETDRQIASLTNRIWVEPKLIVIAVGVLLAIRLLIREGLFYYDFSYVTWQELSYLIPELILRYQVWLVVGFWVLYFIINDIRYHQGNWWHGVISYVAEIFRIRSLQFTFEKRLMGQLRWVVVSEIVLVLLAACALFMFMSWFLFGIYMPSVFWLYLLFAVAMVVLIVSHIRYARQQRELYVGVETLITQIDAVHDGNLSQPMKLPKDPDLANAAEALNEIQKGLSTALDKQIKSEQMKVELISNVSHDIKTPLTSIISYIELLKEEEDLPPHLRDYVLILDGKAQRLKEMVQDVFEVSKAASGQLPVNLQRLDFAKLLRQTLADMQEVIEQSDVTLRSELPQEAVMIEADGQRLYRVFQNLIGNALRYSLSGSRVYVYLHKEGTLAVASIKNTSQDELPKDVDFTERFVRGDVSRSDGGSGLGLSIARSFTEACHGEFKVSTNADLFTVTVSFELAKEFEQPEVLEEKQEEGFSDHPKDSFEEKVEE